MHRLRKDPQFTARAARRAVDREAGGAVIFVLMITAVALFIASVSVSASLRSRRASSRTLHATQAFYCAETGMARARDVVGSNTGDWNDVLAGSPGTWPAWYPVSGICPDNYSFVATMRDNVDEMPPTPNNPQADADQSVIVDVVAMDGQIPVARISGVVQVAAEQMMRDYATQDRLGAGKAGNI